MKAEVVVLLLVDSVTKGDIVVFVPPCFILNGRYISLCVLLPVLYFGYTDTDMCAVYISVLWRRKWFVTYNILGQSEMYQLGVVFTQISVLHLSI